MQRGPGCWIWTAWCDNYGYGVLRVGPKALKAHRLIYEDAVGPIPDGMVLDHLCYNPPCVRPDHLRPVTRKHNVENVSKPVPINNTSGYRGVSLHKKTGLWNASVHTGGKKHSAGYYKTAAEAGEAARLLRLKLFTHNELDRVKGVGAGLTQTMPAHLDGVHTDPSAERSKATRNGTQFVATPT